jgi:hypothetical protein
MDDQLKMRGWLGVGPQKRLQRQASLSRVARISPTTLPKHREA